MEMNTWNVHRVNCISNSVKRIAVTHVDSYTITLILRFSNYGNSPLCVTTLFYILMRQQIGVLVIGEASMCLLPFFYFLAQLRDMLALFYCGGIVQSCYTQNILSLLAAEGYTRPSGEARILKSNNQFFGRHRDENTPLVHPDNKTLLN